jgi:hypothetical protein
VTLAEPKPLQFVTPNATLAKSAGAAEPSSSITARVIVMSRTPLFSSLKKALARSAHEMVSSGLAHLH